MKDDDKFRLTKAQLVEVRKGRRQLADLIPHIDAAEACGVDCEERKLMREELDRRLAAMEEHYSGK